jgi:hypothetical protein
MARNAKLRKGFRLVWHTVVWSLWGARNDDIFNGVKKDYSELVEVIKVLSWKWSSERLKISPCLYYEWSWDPGDCFLRWLLGLSSLYFRFCYYCCCLFFLFLVWECSRFCFVVWGAWLVCVADAPPYVNSLFAVLALAWFSLSLACVALINLFAISKKNLSKRHLTKIYYFIYECFFATHQR